MRPLPDLSPLPANPTVYDQSQDNWLSILGGDLSAFDSLQHNLVGESAGAVSSGPGIGSSIASMGGSLNEAIAIFDTLSAADQAIDLTNTISESFELDAGLVQNFDGFHPNVNALATPILNYIVQFVSTVAHAILNLVVAFFEQLLQLIQELFALVFA